jgi:alpha-1,3-rhamnosyl/mannosyltransferase
MALIALDGRKYFDFGIGTYIQQLVRSLSKLKTEHKFLLYVTPSDVAAISLPPGWTMMEVGYPKYSVSEIGLLGLRAKRDKVDVFHEPHYTLPIAIGYRSIVTIHDIIHLRFPQLFNAFQRAYSYSMITHSLRTSRFIIADSEFTKNDILRSFRLSPEKIRVIHLGVGEQYRPLRDHGRIREFSKRFGIQRPYALYVGNVKPHKGIDTLLSAFAQIQLKEDLDLVIVGGSIVQDRNLGVQAAELGILSRIKELGHLNEYDLVTAYNAAELLVMPSRYEGFGLPALEAMACGCPVVVSNAASLPEIVGDAAMVFRAGNSQELADMLLRLIKERTLRTQMIRKGRKQAARYTWGQTATQTLDIYEHIIRH